ncbi:hypothetical protein [Kitasatospora sp. NPDC006786]|uniref:hypothetical protein n=1 Tax=unclassified Kitasatospora TaxID=2633591 RepID=UPI0033D7707C
MGFSSRKSSSSESTGAYRAEVDVTTADGRQVTYSGSGVAPAGISRDDVLDSAEAAALHAEPGGAITGSRFRRA